MQAVLLGVGEHDQEAALEGPLGEAGADRLDHRRHPRQVVGHARAGSHGVGVGHDEHALLARPRDLEDEVVDMARAPSSRSEAGSLLEAESASSEQLDQPRPDRRGLRRPRRVRRGFLPEEEPQVVEGAPRREHRRGRRPASRGRGLGAEPREQPGDQQQEREYDGLPRARRGGAEVPPFGLRGRSGADRHEPMLRTPTRGAENRPNERLREVPHSSPDLPSQALRELWI